MRRSFDFRTFGTVSVSFDPREFLGLRFEEIREAMRSELPLGVDGDDLNYAASVIEEAVREIR
jgi:hypothetical protein